MPKIEKIIPGEKEEANKNQEKIESLLNAFDENSVLHLRALRRGVERAAETTTIHALYINSEEAKEKLINLFKLWADEGIIPPLNIFRGKGRTFREEWIGFLFKTREIVAKNQPFSCSVVFPDIDKLSDDEEALAKDFFEINEFNVDVDTFWRFKGPVIFIVNGDIAYKHMMRGAFDLLERARTSVELKLRAESKSKPKRGRI